MPEIYDFPYQKPEQPEVLPEPENVPAVFVFVAGIVHQVLCNVDPQSARLSLCRAEGGIRCGSFQRVVRETLIHKSQTDRSRMLRVRSRFCFEAERHRSVTGRIGVADDVAQDLI